jgi:hypothetical protein
MSVTIDALGGTPGGSSSNVTTMTYNGLTIGAGNCLVVMFAANLAPVFSAVTWGSQNLPLTPTVQSIGASSNANMWVLMNPTAGNQSLVLTWATPSLGRLWALSLKSVATFTTNTATGNSATASYSIGSAIGHLALDLAENNAGDWVSSGGGVQNQILLDISFSPRLGSSYETDQSTASFSWSTAGGSVPFAATMLDFAPLSGLNIPKYRSLTTYALPDW